MKRAFILAVVSVSLVATTGCKRLFKRERVRPVATSTQPAPVVLEDPTDTPETTQPLATVAPTTRPVVTPKAPIATASSPAAPVAMAFVAGQTWNGSYTCVQGATGVALHITHVTGNAVDAVFDFTVPSAPNGKYKMSGVYDPDARHLRLDPGAWIVQPKGYGPVPVDARVSADNRTYSGTIDAAGCSDFTVRR